MWRSTCISINIYTINTPVCLYHTHLTAIHTQFTRLSIHNNCLHFIIWVSSVQSSSCFVVRICNSISVIRVVNSSPSASSNLLSDSLARRRCSVGADMLRSIDISGTRQPICISVPRSTMPIREIHTDTAQSPWRHSSVSWFILPDKARLVYIIRRRNVMHT